MNNIKMIKRNGFAKIILSLFVILSFSKCSSQDILPMIKDEYIEPAIDCNTLYNIKYKI
jgi:hypothetical protein